jgi:hypothetical protein
VETYLLLNGRFIRKGHRMSSKTLLAAAAMAGLIAGAQARGQSSAPVSSSHPRTTIQQASTAGQKAIRFDDDSGKHDCKGLNGCKGQGGCKTGDAGCKGQNTCKGKGGCKTNGHDCKGLNSCKGQGGCKTGDAGCKGQNTCKGKGGCKTAGPSTGPGI